MLQPIEVIDSKLKDIEQTEGSVLDVIYILLRFCSENENFLPALKEMRWTRALLENAVENFKECLHFDVRARTGENINLRSRISEHNASDVVRNLIETRSNIVKLWPENQDERAIAFAKTAAKAIDEVYNDTWIALMRNNYGMIFDVHTIGLVPILNSFPEEQLRSFLTKERRLVPTLATLEGDKIAVRHISLTPTTSVKITFDTSAAGNHLDLSMSSVWSADNSGEYDESTQNKKPVATFGRWPLLATGLMNRACEIDYSEVTESGSRFIRDLWPKNIASDLEKSRGDQLERFHKLMDLSRDNHVDVLVLPELCFDGFTQSQISNLFLDGRFKDHPASVVVIGSSHICTPCESKSGRINQVNRLRIFIKIASGKWLSTDHHKFNPSLDMKSKEYEQNHGRVDEQLDGIHECIKIICGCSWSVVPLICKDFLSPKLDVLWPTIRPTMILVPAYSPISGAFTNAAIKAASCRSIVVVSDNGLCEKKYGGGLNCNRGADRPKCGLPVLDNSENRDQPSIEDREKFFAIFGVYGADATGRVAVKHDAGFEGSPELPQLICLFPYSVTQNLNAWEVRSFPA
jgi:hypothetical protein